MQNKEKPLEVAYREFVDAIVKTVNSCELPPFICVLALKDILTELNKAAEDGYQQALSLYNAKEG